MNLPSLLLAAMLPATAGSQQGALLSAVPDDAYALIHVRDPHGLRTRAERNDWVSAYGSDEGERALLEIEEEFEHATGTDFDGLFELALALHGEALLFVGDGAAGFLTEPPPDRAELTALLDGWLGGEPRTLEIAGARVRLAAWSEGRRVERAGYVLASLDHPEALGLYSGNSAEAVLAAVTASLGALGSDHRAPVVEGYLSAGGGAAAGVEAFIDFTPFVHDVEAFLREAVAGFLPDPTDLLGLEQGTWLLASADLLPGTQVDVRARLRIPEATLAARLADSFEPLPTTLASELPREAWAAWAWDWNPGRFWATARAELATVGDGLTAVDQGLEGVEAMSGVEPIEDLVEQLAGWYALYHVLDGGALPADEETGFGFLVGLVDGDRFLEAVEALLGSSGFDLDMTELEGAQVYSPEAEGSDSFGDGGFAFLPERFLMSPGHATLVRGLQALRGVEGASLPRDGQLRRAFDSSADPCAFGYAELSHLRALAGFDEPPGEGTKNPFESQLVVTVHRTAAGFEARLYTR